MTVLVTLVQIRELLANCSNDKNDLEIYGWQFGSISIRLAILGINLDNCVNVGLIIVTSSCL